MNAEASALDLLDALWQGQGVPVDSAWIAGQLGVRVVETDLPSEVSCALVKEFNQDPQLVLSTSDSTQRQRFSCARALGRYLFRSNHGEDTYSYIELRSRRLGDDSKEEDVFASKFARSLLMPKETIQSVFEYQKEPFLIAFTFGVCPEIVSLRLADLETCHTLPLATRWFSGKAARKVRVAQNTMVQRPFQSTDSIATRFGIRL